MNLIKVKLVYLTKQMNTIGTGTLHWKLWINYWDFRASTYILKHREKRKS
jgi:hypothetical protein